MTTSNLSKITERINQRLVALNSPLFWTTLVLVSLTWLLSSLVGLSFPDLWWQLKEGLYSLQTGSPQSTISASYAPQIPGPHWDYHFYEVGLALLYQLGGLPILRILFVLVSFFPFAFTLALLIRMRRLDSYTTLCLTMAMACYFSRVQQRPELVAFSVMLLLGLHLIWIGSAGTLRLILAPLLLMTLWTNLHASFILGLAICLAWAGSTWLPLLARRQFPPLEIKRSFITIGAAFLGGSLHPEGLHRWIEPFTLQSSLWSKLNSSEMWPPTTSIAIFYTVILILVLVTTLLYRRIGWANLWTLAMPVLFLLMSMSSYRYMVFAGISYLWLALLPSPGHFLPARSKLLPILFVLACIPLTIALMTIMFPIYIKSMTSASFINTRNFDYLALQYLSQYQPRSKIFSDIRTSSLTAFLYPEMRYYLHAGFSRFDPEALKTYFYMNHDPVRFLEELDQMGRPEVIVGGWNAHWALALDASPDYELVFLSDQGAVYVDVRKLESFPRNYTVETVLLPQLSRLNKPELKAEVLRYHLPELAGSIQGVLFLEYWLLHQNPEKLDELMAKLTPQKANIICALTGRSLHSKFHLPGLILIRSLMHTGKANEAARLYKTEITYHLQREQLEPVFLNPLISGKD